MRADWTDEQRTLLAHKQEELAELKTRLTPKQFETAPDPEPKASQLEDWRKQRLIALCLLFFINGSALITATYHLLTAPDEVELMLPSEQVQEFIPESHDGGGIYRIQLTSDDLTYRVDSRKQLHPDYLSLVVWNLIFIAALIDAYRREARLLRQSDLR